FHYPAAQQWKGAKGVADLTVETKDRTGPDRRASIWTLVAMLAIFAATILPYLLLPLNPHYDERRYSIGAAQMIESGDYVAPRTHKDELRLLKPPLTYYYLVAGFRLFGENQFAAKAAMAASALAIVALTYALGLGLGAGRLAALLGAAMVGGHRVFFTTASQHLPDMPLILGTTTALVGAVHVLRAGRTPAWAWYALFLGAAFGVLAKGMLPLMLLAVFAACLALPAHAAPGPAASGGARPTGGTGHVWAAAALGLAAAASWFVAVYLRHPDALLAQFLDDQVSGKASFGPLTVLAGLRKPVTDLTLSFLPGAAAIALAWRQRDRTRPWQPDRAFWMVAGWCVATLLVFAFSRHLYERYTLPAAPAFAALCAVAASRIPVDALAGGLRLSSRFFLAVAAATGLAGAVVAGLLGHAGLALIALAATLAVAVLLWRISASALGGIVAIMAVAPLFDVAQVPVHASLVFPTDGQIAAGFDARKPMPPGGLRLVLDDGRLVDHVGLATGDIVRTGYAEAFDPAEHAAVKRVYFKNESHIPALEAAGFEVMQARFLRGLKLDGGDIRALLRSRDRNTLLAKDGRTFYIAARP
ncbi:MAG: phospholipid carrier-dependent glycosyltransferase, partial [Pseudomonadota bacterium]|nr:phospholipid carrier-dependent glycosyltransferase [Pseudomonadota bacterium]